MVSREGLEPSTSGLWVLGIGRDNYINKIIIYLKSPINRAFKERKKLK